MAKRLTDTDKWKDEWYSNLSNDYKIIWQWLLDNCDHAGICKKNMRLLNFMCNTSVKEEEIIEVMEGRVVSVKDNWFIPNFLKFQYKTLTSKKPVIVSVVNRLLETNCYTMIPKSFGNDYLIIKDKDKDIVNDKDIYKIETHETKENSDQKVKTENPVPPSEPVQFGLSNLDRFKQSTTDQQLVYKFAKGIGKLSDFNQILRHADLHNDGLALSKPNADYKTWMQYFRYYFENLKINGKTDTIIHQEPEPPYFKKVKFDERGKPYTE